MMLLETACEHKANMNNCRKSTQIKTLCSIQPSNFKFGYFLLFRVIVNSRLIVDLAAGIMIQSDSSSFYSMAISVFLKPFSERRRAKSKNAVNKLNIVFFT